MKRVSMFILGNRCEAGRCAVVALLFVSMLACSRPAVTAATFEPVYRAASAITSATGVGVAYAAFGDLVRALATELDLARVKASTPEERSIVDAAERAMAAYKDSMTIWALKIQDGAILSQYIPAVKDLVVKYEVAALPNDYYRADDVLQAAWARGGAAVEELKKAYLEGIQ